MSESARIRLLRRRATCHKKVGCNIERPEHPSITHLLYQQFQEQSFLCDVIVKVGSWEKRFHWCVLAASPFFEAIHRNSFTEKRTGIVELHKWPASLVELSLLFLYGKEPEVTQTNVDKLLDIAEFLHIPRLKSDCIDFLERAKVTKDNCMHLFELSSMYGFYLYKCEPFLKGHLLEILEQEGMLNATTESIKMLLADPTLSYVPVQKWIRFLIRWVQRYPERLNDFVELFKMLALSECDRDLLKNIIAEEPLVTKAKEEIEQLLTSCLDVSKDTVIIFETSESDSLMCLNMRTMGWFKIIDNDHDPIGNKFIGVSEKSSCIYKIMQSSNPVRVVRHDLSNGQSASSKIVFEPRDFTNDVNADFCGVSRQYSLVNDTLVVVSNKLYYISRPMPGTAGNASRFGRLQTRYSRPTLPEGISTLYIGKLTEPVTEMNAILSLKNTSIRMVCLGHNGNIAMLSFDSTELFIFDILVGTLECVKLPHATRVANLRMEAARDGFVIHGEQYACISQTLIH